MAAQQLNEEGRITLFKQVFRIIVYSFLLSFLTGCLYPQEKRVENEIPYPGQIAQVEQAVEQFQNDTGVLPIKTRDMSTPIYQKYPIDFGKLIPRYLPYPPGNSFENGGVFQYVLINVEEKPKVKLLHLVMVKDVQEVQRKLYSYMSKNNQRAPVKGKVAEGLFKLDYEKLGYKEELRVQSPYYGNYLPLLIDEKANVVIDYTIDLHMALNEFDHQFKQGDDIRSILTNHFPFVPAFSVPYTIDENGEPVYMTE